MSEFKGRFLYSLDLQFISSSYLVLACMFYSGSCHDSHVHYRRLSSLWSMQCLGGREMGGGRVGKACKEAIIFML